MLPARATGSRSARTASPVTPPGRLPSFRLIESLAWDGSLHRVDRHLGRMERSAARFGRPFDEDEARDLLSDLAARLQAGVTRKVRLTLGPGGELEVEAVEVDPLPDPVPILLTDVRVDRENELLYHKTDRRELYAGTRGRAAQRGYREVLFRNTRGEVTEGSFTNLFLRSGGSWLTPPVACGLLPGIFRQVLLERLEGAEERVLLPEDVVAADSVWICNSVRGLARGRVTLEGAG